jgi:divalent metal cation (Fe/Co/Zn/Cd) transporter
MFCTPRGAATLSLLANLTLVGLKLGVGLAIGSIGVLSDAVDSDIPAHS